MLELAKSILGIAESALGPDEKEAEIEKMLINRDAEISKNQAKQNIAALAKEGWIYSISRPLFHFSLVVFIIAYFGMMLLTVPLSMMMNVGPMLTAIEVIRSSHGHNDMASMYVTLWTSLSKRKRKSR